LALLFQVDRHYRAFYKTTKLSLMYISTATYGFANITTMEPVRNRKKGSPFQIGSSTNYGMLEQQEPSRLTGFEIIWFMKGKGALTVDGFRNLLDDNIIYFLAPGQWRHLEIETEAECYIMDFSIDFLNISAEHNELFFLHDYYGNSVVLPTARITEEVLREMEELMQKMIKEFASHKLGRMEIVRGMLKLFLLYFSIHIDFGDKSACPKKDKVFVKRYLDMVKKEYRTKKMVADYANELCVTPGYLNDIVKRVSGFSASHHIQQCIINEAKNQALYSGLNMKEIAFSLGYNDLAHFSKFFKNAVGMNFTAFKRGLGQTNLWSETAAAVDPGSASYRARPLSSRRVNN